jgi:hypothetical protein
MKRVKKMKRRCNICLQNKRFTLCTKFNDEVTVCFTCQAIIKRISEDDALDNIRVKT